MRSDVTEQNRANIDECSCYDIARSADDDDNSAPADEPVFNTNDFPPWPATVPPFVQDALYAGVDDHLYVQRTRLRSDAGRVMDIFGATKTIDDEAVLVRLRIVRGKP